ncbi:MAG: hypothetical protein R3C16_01405 [Hyphomonadaceae bacterium]
MEYVETGEVTRVMIVVPGFGDSGTNSFSSGMARLSLANWENRHRSSAEIETEINRRLHGRDRMSATVPSAFDQPVPTQWRRRRIRCAAGLNL